MKKKYKKPLSHAIRISQPSVQSQIYRIDEQIRLLLGEMHDIGNEILRIHRRVDTCLSRIRDLELTKSNRRVKT